MIRRASLLVLLFGAAAPSFASCAVASEDTEATTPNDAAEHLVEASADTSCDGGDATCTELRACEAGEFCPEQAPLDPRLALTAVWGSGKSDVWAIGSAGTVLHWDGVAWTSLKAPTSNTLRAIWGSAPGDVWIVAAQDAIFHGTGPRGGVVLWDRVPAVERAPVPLRAIWGTSANDRLWVAGDGVVASVSPSTQQAWRTGASDASDGGWDRTAPMDRLTAYGVWGAEASDVWVVGLHARTFHGRAGDAGGALEWTEVDSHISVDLEAVWGSAAKDVWAVGRNGIILRHTGVEGWQESPSPTTQTLHSIWGSSASDIWAVGDSGTILHFDGRAWSAARASFPPGPKPALYSVWGSRAEDVVVVGEGIVLRLSAKEPSR